MNALLTSVKKYLASYFDIEIGESVVQHYESISLIEVNAKSLLECICNYFIRDDIPLQNLVADLSVSTNYMRGKRGGLEKLLRSKAPQLLDTVTFAIISTIP